MPAGASDTSKGVGMPFCIHCRTENPDTAVYCQQCGKAIVAAAQPTEAIPSPASGLTQPASLQPTRDRPASPKGKQKKSNGWCLACIIVGVLFLVTCTILLNIDPDAPRHSSNKPHQYASCAIPPISITATALATEYADNAVAADKKYENKRLRVTGKVRDIGKDVLDTAYVVIKGGGEYEMNDVQCMFREDQEQELASLKKGQTVIIEGESTGEALGLNVILRYCELK